MKALIISEADIQILMERLELEHFRLQGDQKPVNEIHRQFNYVIVNWFHEQGSNYPNP